MQTLNDTTPEKISLQNQAFRIGMLWRIAYGSFRVLVGLMLVQFIHQPFPDFLRTIFRNELIENPNDLFATQLLNFFSHHDFTITFFFAFYIIFWGVMDIFLSICLLKHQHWAFPFSLFLIASFMIYEILRFLHTHSITLLILLTIDSVVFWLIYREYKNRWPIIKMPWNSKKVSD